FFAKNSTFQKEELQKRMIGSYQQARDAKRALKKLPKGIRLEDLVFAELRESLLPDDANGAAEDALDILIAYYFEACDLFNPNVNRGEPNASP
ncbi:MAG: hypothetical protein ACRCZF_11150, partial [Gemmataceae bacterium]